MKKFLNLMLNPLGYEVIRLRQNQFEIAGVKYQVDPCSVGLTPQGEQTGLAAVRLIKERNLKQLKVLDLCCGVGIVGLTLFATLRQTDHVAQVCFADINIFNLNSLRRVLSLNNLGAQFQSWLSDGLDSIPPESAFDLIVSNPPHFFIEDFMKEFSPGRLGGFDPQWEFHRKFYAHCDKYLSPRGEVWFLENGDGAREEDFLPYIRGNPALEYVARLDEPRLPGFFWMITRKISA
jgi:methylase of polypeptide subunit release factors